MTNFDPITLALVLGLMALLPTLVVTTSFLKISIVMMLVRNALCAANPAQYCTLRLVTYIDGLHHGT